MPTSRTCWLLLHGTSAAPSPPSQWMRPCPACGIKRGNDRRGRAGCFNVAFVDVSVPGQAHVVHEPGARRVIASFAECSLSVSRGRVAMRPAPPRAQALPGAADSAKERTQFNAVNQIGSFQAVKHHCQHSLSQWKRSLRSFARPPKRSTATGRRGRRLPRLRRPMWGRRVRTSVHSGCWSTAVSGSPGRTTPTSISSE